MPTTASIHPVRGQPAHTQVPRKLWLGVAALVMAVAVILFWALPYWSIAGLLKAASNSDVEGATKFIQEGRVERTIREQTSEAVQTQAAKVVDQGWSGAEAALATDKSAPLADELSNVSAVTELIRTHIPANGSRLAAALDIATSQDSGWVSADEYRVTAPGNYVFSWKRRNASWQLVDVEIPQHVIESAAITGDSPVIEPKVEVFKHP